MNNPFIPALIIITLGMLLQKHKFLGEGAGQVLSRIVMNITLPAVVLTTLTKAELPSSAFFLPVGAALWSLFMLGVGLLCFGRKPKRTGGVMILTLMGFNIGQFAYPLVEAAWGREALALVVMYDIGNAVVLLGLGYTLAGIWAGQPATPKAILHKLLTHVPLLGYVAAISMNLTGLQFPAFIETPLEILGRANHGLVLLLMGMYLNPRIIIKQLKQVLAIISLRYALSASLGLALFFLLPAPYLIRSIILVLSMLPVPMATIPFSVEYDLDPELAGAVANATIILSFGLLWVVFALL